ncbi:hypothetical protein PQE66_gp005 [Bacillus phage PBC2]|uniref:Uncharacterized protein n=1 Tax=Bacillus phage PBC2 TaxID=1675029 RepID=A0A218KBP9_9CAUD|nr:hypothetical protein PQE66_gp005 [Bacillus phage PBC2]AKQ08320.1 hypothetical protein PBC2_005 [Bacillus phage PBC2]
MTKYLYRFYFSYGRGGISGLVVATEEDVANAIGEYVDFGEAMGKHSEVYGYLKESNFEKLDVAPEAVKEVAKYLGNHWSGYNPFDYIYTRCDNCKDECDEDDLKELDGDYVCEYCYKELTEDEEDED